MAYHCDVYYSANTLKAAVEALAADKFVFLTKLGSAEFYLISKD